MYNIVDIIIQEKNVIIYKYRVQISYRKFYVTFFTEYLT